VRSFAAWLGHPLPPGNGFGLIALEGQFAARDGVYSLSHTHLAFDSMNLNGEIAIDTNPDVLTLKGHVTVDRVNINPYLAPGAHDDTVVAAKSAHPDAPLALHGLKTVNADLTLIIGGLVLPYVKLDQAVVKVALNSGVLKADMTSITAYGGTGKGNFTVDASSGMLVLHHELDVRVGDADEVPPHLRMQRHRQMTDAMVDVRHRRSRARLVADGRALLRNLVRSRLSLRFALQDSRGTSTPV